MPDGLLNSATMTVCLLACLLGGPAVLEAQDDPDLDVTIYRSWRPPDVTVVEGLFWVRPAALDLNGEAGCPYSVELVVRDPNTILVEDGWTGQCPGQEGDIADAAVMETFQFGVRPATYTVEITVGAGGAEREMSLEVQGFGGVPPASDLVLGREVDWVDSANVDRWTFRRGDLGILTAPDVVVEPEDPSLAYYLEVYAEEGETLSGDLSAAIVNQQGTVLHTVELAAFSAVDESRPLTGSISLAGLPPGEYELEARLAVNEEVVTRNHEFRMAQPRTVAADQGGAEGTGYFGELTDEELERLFDPLVLWLDSERAREQYRGLGPDARRRFLQQFFGGAVPSPTEDSEEPLDIYLERVRYANEAFGETAGRRDIAAWETDRGEVYILRGAPDAQIQRPLPREGSPYEIWSYDIGRGYVYLFADQSGLGNYQLILSTDPEYNTLPGWQRQVGGEVFQDLERFGVRPEMF